MNDDWMNEEKGLEMENETVRHQDLDDYVGVLLDQSGIVEMKDVREDQIFHMVQLMDVGKVVAQAYHEKAMPAAFLWKKDG